MIIYINIAKNIVKTHGLIGLIVYALRELERVIVRQLMYGSYAQNWEDLEIARMFKTRSNGFYIDIGAHHPTRLSNTYHFYLKGWKGITVEPNKEVEEKFRSLRPADIHLTVGVGKKASTLDFFRFTIPALSTFSSKSATESQANGYHVENIVKIPIITTDQLLKHVPPKTAVDLLSLDTEGWDFPILESWDFNRYAPQIICVEQGIECVKIDHFLNSKKYEKVFSNGINAIFKSKK